MTAEQQLERSVLEGKERDELHAIAQALSVKTNTRTKKADMIDGILKATGVSVDDAAARGAGASGNGDGSNRPTANGRRPARSSRATAGGDDGSPHRSVESDDSEVRPAGRRSARRPTTVQSFGPADDAEQAAGPVDLDEDLPDPSESTTGPAGRATQATSPVARQRSAASRPVTEVARAPGGNSQGNQGNRNNQNNQATRATGTTGTRTTGTTRATATTRAAETTTWGTAGAIADAGAVTVRAAEVRAIFRVPAGRSSSTRAS